MPNFTRYFLPGGAFFFTVVAYQRRSLFLDDDARRELHTSIAEVQAIRPFEMPAIVLLPDHLHCIWTLPPNDSDFSTRWRRIKETFTRRYLSSDKSMLNPSRSGPQTRHPKEVAVTDGQSRKGLRGVWQQRFWEHTIRDELDFERHVNYIHFNPVKHDLCRCAHDWPWSTFSRWVSEGYYERTWYCRCDGKQSRALDFSKIEETAME